MTSPEVTVIDYGVGNLLSVCRGLEHCGANVKVSNNPNEILKAKRAVLPGVGAFANAMQALKDLNLIPAIHELAKKDTPLLGICLGMQLLLDESEEFGLSEGLGLIPGRVVPVPTQTSSGEFQKTPHIGWSQLCASRSPIDWENSVLHDTTPGEATYFVHSYMARPKNSADTVANCIYGGTKISAVIRKNNITGCQFHPEKSGESGLKILRRFIAQ